MKKKNFLLLVNEQELEEIEKRRAVFNKANNTTLTVQKFLLKSVKDYWQVCDESKQK